MRPVCFPTDDLYEDYMERLRRTAPKGATFCWDCTPEFQQEMIEDGKCCHPETKFVVVKIAQTQDESLQGVRL